VGSSGGPLGSKGVVGSGGNQWTKRKRGMAGEGSWGQKKGEGKNGDWRSHEKFGPAFTSTAKGPGPQKRPKGLLN